MKLHFTTITLAILFAITLASWQACGQQSTQPPPCDAPANTAGQHAELRVGNASVSAQPLTRDIPANICGVAVDPRFPEFELYTSKVVLFRLSCLQALAQPQCRQQLIDVANAAPFAIVLIPARTEPATGAMPLLGVPLLTIAPQDSATVIGAAAGRRQISILIH